VVTIIPDLLPADHPLASHPMTPRWITIHDTANPNPGANAAMHGRYLRTQAAIDRQVMWHFTVDDREIRQHLPLDRNGWHAGDGWDGPGNRQSIAIEICENADGDRAAAEANAAQLVAHLIRTVPTLLPFPECVVQHNRWSGKDCPRVLRGRTRGWEGFIAMVEQNLQAEQRTPVPIRDAGGRLLASGWLDGNTTVVGLRELAEALGLQVEWNQQERAATLRWPGRQS
jgi:Copper amine oxidase N-terminal domain./N-acetylmuramoyl-L-alanine amidase.